MATAIEITGFGSCPHLEMDDSLFFFEQSLVDELNSDDFLIDSSNKVLNFKRPAPEVTHNMPTKKQMKTATCTQSDSYNCASIASQSSGVHQNCHVKPDHMVKRISNDIYLHQARQHSLAERKRREKLSQRIVALSTLIPGLKKMDKVSVLGDAIEYMKKLQRNVKTLEGQKKKRNMESVVYSVGDDGREISSADESLPEIEVRFCNKEVLVSIHCKRRKGILERIGAEIEKLHLSVVNVSVVAYGDSALNITVIAEKNEGVTVSTKDLVNNLISFLG